MAYARLILLQRENCQLGRYGQKYWGAPGWVLGSLVVLVNINGALLAYLIGAGDFLHFLFPQLSSFKWGLVFLFLVLPVVILGLRSIVKVNALVVWALVLLLVVFLGWGMTRINPGHFWFSSENDTVRAFSVFFFSYAGFAVIPELAEVMEFKRKQLFQATTIGSLLPGVLYFLFALIGVGVFGGQLSEEFIYGLGKISLFWSRLMGLVGLMAIITSFFAFSFALKEFWQRDFGLDSLTSLVLTFLPAGIFYLGGNRDFLGVISFTGGASCLLMATLILSCFLKEKIGKKRR